jgi:SanA protein
MLFSAATGWRRRAVLIILRALFVIVLAAAAAVFAPRAYTAVRYSGSIVEMDQAPGDRVAIVFGAGLRRNGSASPVLYDRVATAAALYQAGKVSRLLLSGDNTTLGYNEPQAMMAAALELGVPESALVMDYAGRSTYDTCYRAHAIFGLSSALLVTQAFHLPRALYLCDAHGISGVGVSADRRPYSERSTNFWAFREVFATAAAWWDVNIVRPEPVLGQPLPIAD